MDQKDKTEENTSLKWLNSSYGTIVPCYCDIDQFQVILDPYPISTKSPTNIVKTEIILHLIDNLHNNTTHHSIQEIEKKSSTYECFDKEGHTTTSHIIVRHVRERQTLKKFHTNRNV